MESTLHPRQVTALVYDRLCAFEYGCVVELFDLHRPELGVPWYHFDRVAAEPGPLQVSGGMSMDAPYQLSRLAETDLVVIPGWRDADERPPQALLDAIRYAWDQGVAFCTICSGVFVLAAAGVLAGRRVTTHWRYAERLAARYPELEVDADALYIDEGQVVTSAGSAAGLDMLLYLVRKDYGGKIANQVAQRLVVPPFRDGGQAQFVPRPVPEEGPGRLQALMVWLRQHLHEPHSVDSMAAHAAMSARTLQRQFLQVSGMSPLDWLTRERVALAQHLLESSQLELAEVAEQAGFGSEESLRRHFRRVVLTSPAQYRKQFAAAMPQLAS